MQCAKQYTGTLQQDSFPECVFDCLPESSFSNSFNMSLKIVCSIICSIIGLASVFRKINIPRSKRQSFNVVLDVTCATCSMVIFVT